MADVLSSAAVVVYVMGAIETPPHGVSLTDLAARPTHVLVRTPDGARLAADPWMIGADSFMEGVLSNAS